MLDPVSVTVIIPTYNRCEELRRALHHLVLQTDPDFDVIVCDDGSSENIKAVVDEFVNKLVIEYQRIERSGGPAAPRNIGLARAQGQWVSFLDSDDWWLPSRMALIKRHLVHGVDVLFHPLITIKSRLADHGGHDKLMGKSIGHGDPLIQMLRFGNPLPTSATVVRTAVLREIGGFYSKPGFLDDFDAWLRLATNGAHFRYIPDVLGFYWVSDNNISKFTPDQYYRQRDLFQRQLSLLPEDYQRLARSNFNYLLGSYEFALGLPDSGLLAKVEWSVEPLRWIKARTKLLRRAFMYSKRKVHVSL